ncbi:MAG: hypothetical protein K8R58_05825, partial [Bacteroidales bacterium]|nr:hypothetical protein [Bacteroidales bacterium]
MYNIFCKDNNQRKDNVSCLIQKEINNIISEGEIKSISQSLNKIANKSLPVLLKDSPNLLVFPSKLNEYNDDIHKSVIFNMYPDNTIKTHNLMGFVGVDD